MAEAEIAIVVSPRDWAERLHRFVADHGGARVRARVLDAREALDDTYNVLVAEDLTSFLTPRIMDQLHRSGRRVLGVYDPDEPWGRQRLTDLGVDETIASDTAPEAFVRAIETLVATMDLDDELSELVGGQPTEESGEPPARAGLVVAVGGPPGGVGVTEVGGALALGLQGVDQRPVLVDADDVAPSVAQRFGLPLHPNIRTAVDAVEHRTGRLGDALNHIDANDGELGVLCGLPTPQDWRQLRPAEARAVIRALARDHSHVIVDTGPHTEDLAARGGPPRFQLTRAMLAAADLVVGVGAPTPVGVARLLDWVADLRAINASGELHLIVNQAPANRFKRGELTEEIRRTVVTPTLTFVPRDERVTDAAWDGTRVRDGSFTRALHGLVARLGRREQGPPEGDEIGGADGAPRSGHGVTSAPARGGRQ